MTRQRRVLWSIVTPLVILMLVLSGCEIPPESIGGVEDAEVPALPTDDVAPDNAASTETLTVEELNREESFDEASNLLGVANAEGLLMRATTLIGYEVVNLADQPIGEISDILLNVDTGYVQFVMLDYGGELDLARTTLPLTLSALTWGPADQLILSVDENELQNLPLPDEPWPDLRDGSWDNDINRFWSNLGVKPPFNATDEMDAIVYVSDLLQLDFGEGAIEDLIIDLAFSFALYLVADPGIDADSLWAVPFVAFAAERTGDRLLFDVMPDTLKDAPTINRAEFAEMDRLDAGLNDEIATYWESIGYSPEPPAIE